MVSNNATEPEATLGLRFLLYCTLLPLKIELFHPDLGPVGTTQLYRQVGFLLLYWKLDFIILLNWCSQLVLFAQIHKFMQLQGCWLKISVSCKGFGR